jgi:hypothetical protein
LGKSNFVIEIYDVLGKYIQTLPYVEVFTRGFFVITNFFFFFFCISYFHLFFFTENNGDDDVDEEEEKENEDDYNSLVDDGKSKKLRFENGLITNFVYLPACPPHLLRVPSGIENGLKLRSYSAALTLLMNNYVLDDSDSNLLNLPQYLTFSETKGEILNRVFPTFPFFFFFMFLHFITLIF